MLIRILATVANAMADSVGIAASSCVTRSIFSGAFVLVVGFLPMSARAQLVATGDVRATNPGMTPTWNAGTELLVGTSEYGKLTINSGGSVSTEWLLLGHGAGSGEIDVNGGTLNIGWLLQVGNGIGGSLTVRNGGSVTVAPGTSSRPSGIVLVDTGGPPKFIEVSSGGSLNSGDWLYLGYASPSGNTSLIISGGSVTSQEVEFYAGLADVSSGSWNISKTLRLQGGGSRLLVRNTGSISTDTLWADGQVDVEGGSFTATDLLAIAYDDQTSYVRTMTISGGDVTAPTVYVGYGEGSRGRLDLNGGNLTTTTLGLGFGEGSQGILNLNGGILTVNKLYGNNLLSFSIGTSEVHFNGGTLRLNAGGEIFNKFQPGRVMLEDDGGTIDTQSFTTATSLGLIGTGALTKSGNGTLTLSGANTYAGGTIITGGTLAVTGSVNHASANFDVGGTLKISGSGSVTNTLGRIGVVGSVGSAQVSGGTWTNSSLLVGVSSDGTLEMTGGSVTASTTVLLGNLLFSTGQGTVNLNGGTLTAPQIQEGTGQGTFTFGGGTLRLSADLSNLFSSFEPGDVTLAAGGGTIDTQGFAVASAYGFSGAGSLTKKGTGTLTLSGTNTHTGGTTIAGGVLSVAADANLGGAGGTLTITGGTLRNTAGFTTTRATTLGAGGGTFQTDASLTQGGVISGTGGLTKTGAGFLLLTAGNTYTGGTTITGGSLQIGAGGTTGSIVGNVVNNGYLFINRSDTYTFGGAISGTGALIQTSTGRTIYTGNSTHSGGTYVYSGGTLQLGNGGTNGSLVGDVTLGAAFIGPSTGFSHLAVNRSDTLTLAGVISGGGSVTQAGTGTLTLTGTNTYTGETIVSAGTLLVNGSVTSDVTVQSGATFGGGGAVYGQVTLDSGSLLKPMGDLKTEVLDWNPGATLAFRLGNGVSDSVDMDYLTGGGPGLFAFTFQDAGWQVGQTYTLLTFGHSEFTGSGFSFTNGSGFDGTFTLHGHDLQFTLVAVPEPGTLILGLAAVASALVHRARRRRADVTGRS